MKKPFWILVFLILTAPLYSTDWYARPKGGTYGAENGTSYAAAWDGIGSVVWGGAGVVAGDTLYICGLHLPAYGDGYVASIGASGTSESWITVRGDSGSEAGEVWGASIIPGSWNSEGSNTYSIALPNDCFEDFIFEDVALGSHTLLTCASSEQNCKDTAGSHWSTDYANGSNIYVHCNDGLDPEDRIVIGPGGVAVNITPTQSYVKFVNLSMYWTIVGSAWSSGAATHFTWEGCTMKYSDGRVFRVRESCDYYTLDTCEIAYGSSGGIYSTTANGGDAADNLHIKDCTIHHIGDRPSTYSGDSHGIGIQDGNNHIYEGNEIYSCGNQLLVYCFDDNTCTDGIIRNNFIHDSHTAGGATAGWGICMQHDGSPESDKTGWVIHGNIITDCTIGIRQRWEDEVKIYNNVAESCGTSYSSEVTGISNTVTYNNISFNPTNYHWEANAGVAFTCDYNLYYPDTGTMFQWYGTDYNYADWKTQSSQDGNSPASADPAFVNAGGSYALDTDFQIPTGSPCKDAGVNVGLGTDYWGTTIPSGAAQDIGVHEYDQGDTPHKAILKSGTKLILGPGVKVVIK